MEVFYRVGKDKLFVKFQEPNRDLFFATVEQVKQIPSRKFADTGWSFDYCLPVIEQLKGIFPQHKFPTPLIENKKEVFVPILPLMNHQEKTIEQSLRYDFSADLSDPGTGKTLSAIELIMQRNVFPVLVVAPISLMEAVWEEEIKKWVDGRLSIQILLGTKEKRIKALKTHAHIYVINYEYVQSLFFDKVGKSYKLNQLFYDTGFKFLILDESTKVKTHNSQRSKAVKEIADQIRYKHIMTGTVAPNGLLDVFHQYRILSPHLFGKGFYTFTNNYFRRGGFQNHEWIPRHGSEGMIQNIMSKISVQHKKRQCLDLPPLTEEKRFYYMSNEHQHKYKRLKEEAIIEIEKEEVITTPFLVSKLAKLSQLSSGFIYDDKKKPIWITDDKIKEVISVAEDIGDKVIIFCHYRASVERLMKYLQGSAVSFYGGMTVHQKSYVIKQFAESKKIKYLVANMASAGHGLNLQFCSNIIYFELNYNYEYYDQSMQRIERAGQKNKMTVYYHMTKNTIHNYILTKLKQKKNLNQKIEVSDFLKELKGE